MIDQGALGVSHNVREWPGVSHNVKDVRRQKGCPITLGGRPMVYMVEKLQTPKTQKGTAIFSRIFGTNKIVLKLYARL